MVALRKSDAQNVLIQAEKGLYLPQIEGRSFFFFSPYFFRAFAEILNAYTRARTPRMKEYPSMTTIKREL